jgi:hypothetical protein
MAGRVFTIAKAPPFDVPAAENLEIDSTAATLPSAFE